MVFLPVEVLSILVAEGVLLAVVPVLPVVVQVVDQLARLAVAE
jgi:hypothetical protein